MSELLTSTVHAGVVSIVSARDTTIYSSGSNLSNGAGEHLFAGVSLHTSTIRRGLLEFDVAGAVPAGSTITSVELRLSMSMTITGPVPVGLHRALSDWGESTSDAAGGEGGGAVAATGDATWFSRFYPATAWTAPGGDFVASATGFAPVDQPATIVWASTPALVADVQSWLDTPATNFGWFLKSSDEMTQPSAKRFDSRENSNPAARPRLTITFSAPTRGTITSYCVSLPNASGAAATIAVSGSTSLTANALVLDAASLPPGAPYLFIMGANATEIPFGDGRLCIGGAITRLGGVNIASGFGAASYALDFLQPPLVGTLAAGDTRLFQCWFRSVTVGGSGFNLSNGASVSFCP